MHNIVTYLFKVIQIFCFWLNNIHIFLLSVVLNIWNLYYSDFLGLVSPGIQGSTV